MTFRVFRIGPREYVFGNRRKSLVVHVESDSLEDAVSCFLAGFHGSGKIDFVLGGLF